MEPFRNRPSGSFMPADVGAPSWKAGLPRPAHVVTYHDGACSIRMRLLARSHTNRLPRWSTATLVGRLKAAVAAGPSANPPAPVPTPAIVVTWPVGVTRRIRWLYWSATNRSPPGPTATPPGVLKLAAVPAPSANDAFPLPAT